LADRSTSAMKVRHAELSSHREKLTVVFRNQTVVTSQRSSLSRENAFKMAFRL